MNLLVTHFASGAAFFTGVVCLLFALGLGIRPQAGRARASTGLAVFGLLAIAASATPLPVWFYWIAMPASLAWLTVERMARERLARSRCMLRIAIAALWLTAAAVEVPYHQLPVLGPADRPVLTIFGDSVTAGISGYDAETWPRVLARTRPLEIHDHAHMGATVASALRQAETTPISAGVVLLEIGGNDLLGGTAVEEFEAGLDDLLARVSGPGRQVVLFELPLPPFYNAFGHVQRRLAKKYGAALIPKRVMMGVLAGEDSTLDSIHLTQRGHDRMAAAVWRVIGEAIERAGSGSSSAGDRDKREIQETEFRHNDQGRVRRFQSMRVSGAPIPRRAGATIRFRCGTVDRHVTNGSWPGARAIRIAFRNERERAMPSWSDKDRRQYEKIKDSSIDRGVKEKRAKEIAARTVNKTRREHGATPSKTTQGTGNPNLGLEDRSKQELYNLAQDLKIAGRSKMKKDELVRAIRQKQ